MEKDGSHLTPWRIRRNARAFVGDRQNYIRRTKMDIVMDPDSSLPRSTSRLDTLQANLRNSCNFLFRLLLLMFLFYLPISGLFPHDAEATTVHCAGMVQMHAGPSPVASFEFARVQPADKKLYTSRELAMPHTWSTFVVAFLFMMMVSWLFLKSRRRSRRKGHWRRIAH